MLQYALAYGATMIAFLLIDYIWLSRVARSFYADRLGALLLEQPRLGMAAGFYLLYGVGIVVFAVMPGLRAESARMVMMLGALLGLVAYGTYDMTNYATLKNWPLSVVAVDMVWGTLLTAIAALAGYLVARMLS
ncbi:DUF2177 family protein [Oricola thermophila]|uniref:DUF2177 family protein n=1 Tax=Oricola thermophila TaxID=2742145 RepID=A0A6N1V954_9HYPH|nr:DUF2177 family protein [Oricola thermophila]QKV17450.1 DUF2177 family protein [Oricola thermophila]